MHLVVQQAGTTKETCTGWYCSRKAAIEAAKARGRAIEYAGRQAGNAAIFGGLMSGIGSLAGAESEKWQQIRLTSQIDMAHQA